MITSGYVIKRRRAIEDEPRKNIDAPRGAFRIGRAMNMARQRQLFLHLYKIDAARLQHRAGAQINLVHDEFIVEPIEHLGARAGQKACAQAIGGFTQAQIEARRLQLILEECLIRNDPVLGDRALQFGIGQDAVARHDSLVALPGWRLTHRTR